MGLLSYTESDRFAYLVGLFGQGGIYSKQKIRENLLQESPNFMKDQIGMGYLYGWIPMLDRNGFFAEGPWENVQNLQPQLVRGTLMAEGGLAAAETLSNLRMLAVAAGDYHTPSISMEFAQKYLDEVLAGNLDVLYLPETEETRIMGSQVPLEIRQLFEFISERHASPGILAFLTSEIKKLSVQRPIITDKIEKLIASGIASATKEHRENTDFQHFEKAVAAPSKLSSKTYAELLKRSPETVLEEEAEQLSRSMNETGLVSEFHVHFLSFAAKSDLGLVRTLLGLSQDGFKRLNENAELVRRIIDIAIKPGTKQAVYGLSRLLERDIFTRDFIQALDTFIPAVLTPSIEKKLKTVRIGNADGASALLLAGAVSVLGQPLGIGQGFNPCCQSTRALSYWAQKEPAYLLELLTEALTRGNIVLSLEGKPVDSSTLKVKELNYTIPMDPVSIVLVPLLDAIYEDMIKRAGFRGEDIHKVINPDFHHKGVLSGFADKYQNGDFSSLFHRYYHPGYSINPINDYLPQPAGIIIYDHNDQALGAHAILIQRVGKDPSGFFRVYFYNPNNDSSQTWGKNIKTSITGNGELEGESSLLFDEFLYCLYAFHFPLYHRFH